MPDKETIERAQEDAREGRSPSTQAGEFVREEIDHIREGKHGAASAKQAIAIGLSKARRAGVKLPPPKASTTSSQARKKAERDLEVGQLGAKKPSPARSRAVENASKKKSRAAASHAALSKRAKLAAAKRGRSSRSQAAKKVARTRARSGHNRYGK
jgi:hypothetical protein